MLRRPLFPIETLYDFNAKVNKHPDQFETELLSFFSQPIPLTAIWTASPGLYNAFSQIKDSKKASDPKTLLSLYKYLIRMCSRPTPYGLFAGIATGTFSDKTSIQFGNHPRQFQTYNRLDMGVFGEIMSDFRQRDHIRSQNLFYVNTSLYFLNGFYRYVETVTNQYDPVHLLSAVQASNNLDRIIKLASRGCTAAQMQEALLENISLQQANQLITAAIEAQLIISELQINVTGPLYEKMVIEKLDNMQAKEESNFLKTLTGLIDDSTCNLDRLRAAENLIAQNYPKMRNKTVIQTDLRFETKQCTVSLNSLQIFEKEFGNIRFLMEREKISALENFKIDFFSRYENREIPLLEALDNESGIGYGDVLPGSCDDLPLLEQLSFPVNSPTKSLNTLHAFKQQIFEQALSDQTLSVNLTDEQLPPIASRSLGQQPGGFYILGSLITGSAMELDSGNFKFLLKAAAGASGFELMGRFCHFDPDLEKRVKSAAKQSGAHPDFLFAEIAHLPGLRTANILQRPHLSEYEIVYLAQSTLPFDNQIPASDLMVQVPNGKEVILRSKRLNKRIIPRLSTAHNYTSGLPVYRFLADVGQQEIASIQGWTWGNLGDRIFLPRVEYKHWILTRAKWTLSKAHFPQLFAKAGNFKTEWEHVCAKLNIPRFFLLCQGDNELLIDGDNRISRLILQEHFSKDEKIRLAEFLQLPSEGLLEHQGKKFTHEIVIPFRSQRARPQLPKTNLYEGQPQFKRHFPPGSEWLYVKIYCGTRTADDILTQLINPFCAQQIHTGVVEKWFFIRYQDPTPHIRLRFHHSKQPAFWQHVTQSLHVLLDPYLQRSAISRIQSDTYIREIERYHPLDPEQSETIFHLDSMTVLPLLEHLQTQEQDARWLAGLYGADLLLNDFGLTLVDKRELTQSVYLTLLEEFSSDGSLTIQLNNQYRRHKPLVYACLGPGHDDKIAALFRQRSDGIHTVLNSNKQSEKIDYQVIASFIHMFLNRLFISKSREQELVIYHYLNKYYKSVDKTKKNQ